MELTAIAAAVHRRRQPARRRRRVIGPVLGGVPARRRADRPDVYGVSQFVQQILTGAILLAAVGYDRLLLVRRRAGSARPADPA